MIQCQIPDITMFIEILTLIIKIGVINFLLLIFFKRSSKYQKKIEAIEEKENGKVKDIEEKLDKYFIDDDKVIMKNKLAKISKIVTDTQNKINTDVQKKVKVVEAQFKHKEIRTIRKAEKRYDSLSSHLTSALPSTEEERKEDMKNLKMLFQFQNRMMRVIIRNLQKKLMLELECFMTKWLDSLSQLLLPVN